MEITRMVRERLDKSPANTGLTAALIVVSFWLAGCSGNDADQPDAGAIAPAETSAADKQQPVADGKSTDEAEETSQPPESTDPPPDDSTAPATESTAEAEGQWGHLTGRFVYDGEPPAREPIELTKDIEFCSKHNPVEQSLIVDNDNHGLGNVVVWLDVRRAEDIPEIHESYQGAIEPAVLDNVGCVFQPHVTLVQTKQKLLIKNTDDVEHNTQAFLDRNSPFNLVIPRSGALEREFERAERQPVKVNCSIHRWMQAWLVIKDHPYFAVSDTDGSFRIENLPAGEWTFRVWHERPEYIDEGTRGGEAFEWPQGKLTLAIEPGDNDLGEILLPPELFAD